MTLRENRRSFLAASVAATVSTTVGVSSASASADESGSKMPVLRLGLMTYNLARDWDLDTIVSHCQQAKFEHAELRTTHAHGVEVSLSQAERREVRQRCEDAGIKLSLASGFAYHWPDRQRLQENIDGTKQYTRLAADIGAIGIRVFPNALPAGEGIPEQQTVEQIAKAASEVSTFAADHGVEIRLANHGRGTNRVTVIKRILDAADCEHIYVNWNCDRTDVDDPGFVANFRSVQDRIRNVHLHELWDPDYPYRQLFSLLRESGYQGYCDAEVSASDQPVRLMRYYRALFLAMQDAEDSRSSS
jgi:sugar phosphate isomerase/epimerase